LQNITQIKTTATVLKEIIINDIVFNDTDKSRLASFEGNTAFGDVIIALLDIILSRSVAVMVLFDANCNISLSTVMLRFS